MKQMHLRPAKLLATLFLAMLIFTGHVAGAQEAKPSFPEKKNQFSLGGELAVSASFSYAHRFSRYAVFGVQVQLGGGLRFLLNDPYFVYMCDQCSEYYRERLRSISMVFFEIAKLQLFYRLQKRNQPQLFRAVCYACDCGGELLKTQLPLFAHRFGIPKGCHAHGKQKRNENQPRMCRIRYSYSHQIRLQVLRTLEGLLLHKTLLQIMLPG